MVNMTKFDSRHEYGIYSDSSSDSSCNSSSNSSPSAAFAWFEPLPASN